VNEEQLQQKQYDNAFIKALYLKGLGP